MKKTFFLLVFLIICSSYSYGKIYATVRSIVFDICTVYIVAFYEDNNNTDPTDDVIIGVDYVLKCSGDNLSNDVDKAGHTLPLNEVELLKTIDSMNKEERSMSIEDLLRYIKGIKIENWNNR